MEENVGYKENEVVKPKNYNTTSHKIAAFLYAVSYWALFEKQTLCFHCLSGNLIFLIIKMNNRIFKSEVQHF